MLSVRHFKHFLTLGVLFLITACTRPEADRSKIEIVIPKSMSSEKIGALSTEVLAHVVINVSGPGIGEPILFEWSNRGPNDERNLNPPTSFSLDVPQGDNRLIQILTVYADMDTSMYSFYYGDAAKSLKAAEEAVPIAVSSVGQGEVIVSGQISGRYFDSATGGPTGKVFVKFKPSETKPSLVLEKSKIINGWFSFFAMQGAKFEYVMDNGKVLFGGPVSLADSRFNPTSASEKLLRVTVPMADRNRSWDYQSYNWNPEESQIHVIGWFSDSGFEAATNGKVICRPSSLTSLTKMGQYSIDLPTEPRTPLTGLLNQTIPSSSALTDLAAPLSNYYVNGGVAESNTACITPSNKYESFLAFKEQMIDGNGKDGAVPFYAPFKLIDTNYGTTPFTVTEPTAGTKRISGELLPGTLPLFDRFLAFKRIGPDFNMDSDRIFCPAIASGAQGFVPAGQANVSSGNFSLDVLLSSSEISQQANVVICLAKGDMIYESGALLRSHMWNTNTCNSNCGGSGGGGGGSGPATQLAFFASEAVTSNSCTYITVAAKNANNNETSVTAATSIALSSNSGANVSFFPENSDCLTGAITSVVSLAANNSQLHLKMKTTLSTGASFTITATDSAGTLTAGTSTVHVVSASQMNNLMTGDFNQKMNVGSCKSITFTAQSDSGSVSGEVGTINFSNISAGISIHSDDSCATAAINTAVLDAGSKTLYTKALSTGWASFGVSYTSAQGITFNRQQGFEIVAAGAPTTLSFVPNVNNVYTSGQCLEWTLLVTDDTSSPKQYTGDISVDIYSHEPGGPNVQYYADSSCVSSRSNIYTYNAEQAKTVYAKLNHANASPISFSLHAQSQPNSTSYLSSSYLPVTINPAPSISLVNSFLSIGSSVILSGNSTMVTLTTKDASNNPLYIPGTSVNFSFSGGSSTVSLGSVTDNSGGTYTVVVNGIVAGTPTQIYAHINGSQVSGSVNVSVQPGLISAANSVIVVSNPTLNVGSTPNPNTATITLQARDANNNMINVGGETVVFNFSLGGSYASVSGTTDNGDGTYTATITANAPGTGTVSAIINGTNVTGSLPSVTISP